MGFEVVKWGEGGGDFLGLGIRVKRDQGIQNFGECLKISYL